MQDKNPEKIKKMFDELSSSYDFVNNILSFFTHKLVKKRAICALKIKENSRLLDLCSGSGDLGRIIKDLNPTCEVVGADFSAKMIEIAREKNKDIIYYNFDAVNLGFDNNSFDYVVVGFGLRNIFDFESALDEIYRVLKPKGLFLNLDFSKTSFFNRVYDFIAIFLMKLIKKDVSAFQYLIKSKNEFFTPEELAQKFKNKGFEVLEIKKPCFGVVSYQILRKK